MNETLNNDESFDMNDENEENKNQDGQAAASIDVTHNPLAHSVSEETKVRGRTQHQRRDDFDEEIKDQLLA